VPESEESHDVCPQVLEHCTWNRTDAVNYERKQAVLTPLDDNAIHCICLDKVYANNNPERPKHIKRCRRLHKTALDKENRTQRIEYTHTIERAIGISIEQATRKEFKVAEDSDTIFIAVDEYAVGFGSSGNELVSAMASEDMYKFAQSEPALQFKLMQWGAAYSHPTDMQQPQVVRETETSELFTELAEKLRIQLRKLADTVEQQHTNVLIPGTTEADVMGLALSALAVQPRSPNTLAKAKR
jgi:hypothetical protein